MTGELLALGASHKTAPLAAAREARAAGRARGARARRADRPRGVHEAVALSTCNRTELYLVTDDALEAENAALGDPLAPGRAAPDRADRLALLAARARGRRAPVLGHRRARLDDRRRGRDPGPGQARLRDGAGRGRQRPGVEPAVPRRARGRQARAHRDRRRRARNVSISTVAVQLAADFLGDLADRRVLVIGAGENAELTARALRDRGVQTLFVANRRYDRALGLAQRFGGRAVTFEDMPRELEAADIVVTLDRRAAPDRRPRGAGVRGGVAHGAAAGDDRPRRAARHRAERARLPRDRALRHGRPAARGGAQPRRARGGGRGGARARARGGRALRELAREPRRGADDLRAAPARRRDRAAGAARERVALGVALARPTASASR